MLDYNTYSPIPNSMRLQNSIGLCDHKGTFVKIKRKITHVKKVKKIKVRDFKNYNPQSFAEEVESQLKNNQSFLEQSNK